MKNTNDKVIFNRILAEILKTKKTVDLDGNVRVVDDMISLEEASVLFNVFKKANTKKSIEVGLAHGTSALVFCQAHADLGNSPGKAEEILHYAIDPNQFSVYRGAAIEAIKRAGYGDFFKLLEGPSHLEFPDLLKTNIKVQCAFIDGWHTFDYTLIDFFLVDKILQPGGYVAFHDGYGRAKQKVVNFILTHRKYEIDKELMNFKDVSFLRVLKFFIWRIYKDPMLLFSWFHWKYQTKRTSGLIILKKVADFEPTHTYFKNF